MKKEKLQKILEDISKVKIAVVGEFCLDVTYWFIDEAMSEISVETNLATRPVSKQRYSLGGAGNVANNLAAMRIGDIRAFGVTGTDPFGAESDQDYEGDWHKSFEPPHPGTGLEHTYICEAIYR
ncbi:MAG: hypothetical protein MZV63_36495 [Marinilabiliales bacterium]|nr:hypothetical protein [Marinilabiliales bacterium]